MDLFDDLRTGLASEEPLLLLVNVALAILLSQVLAWHYKRFAQVLSNKRKFARLFVFIATTTLLVISVVKTSLALSLGLVGALSIIRFRTPIKEPEELAYLFLAIAIGVGLGAGERTTTVLVFVVALLFIGMASGRGARKGPYRTVLQVTAPVSGADRPAGTDLLAVLMPVVVAATTQVDLRRVDCHDDAFNASLLVEVRGIEAVGRLVQAVREALPGSEVSVVERDGVS